MPEDSPAKLDTPRLAFLGFCERAEEVTAGHVVFWKRNLIGVSDSLAAFVFPLNLRGQILVMAIYQPRSGESFRLVFRGTAGEQTFDIVIHIADFILTEAQKDATLTETKYQTGTGLPGWFLMPSKLDADVIVSSEGRYEVFLSNGKEDQYVGEVGLAQLRLPPYTPEEMTALKSDPLATKFVRCELECKPCHQGVRAYAGVERSTLLESQGFRWNLDIKEDEFVCACGTKFSLIPLRTGLHGYLQRNLNPQTHTNISTVRFYEKTALEQYCREFKKLIDANTGEETLQKFLESHPIFFHTFLPRKLLFKPPILTKYFADFALLNERNELVLVEIERPALKMLKQDGGKTAELEHAFHQVRTWAQELDDHRAAALAALDMNVQEVAKVKGVVIAGRKPLDEKMLKTLRWVSTGDIELFTYDDLLSAVTELLKHVASV